MPTECSAEPVRGELFEFGPVEGRAVVAGFDGGALTSDAGALLLGATDRAIGLIGRFAGCFRDGRRAEYVEHRVAALVGQRVFGIALGYEDVNDHDELRHDPVMAALAGKLKARGADCAPVAGKSTLNRLELSRDDVDFIFGLARNARLAGAIEAELAEAREESQATSQPARRFKELIWSTRKSWSRKRRVIAKAEWTKGEANPRFIVTSLTAADGDGRNLYEQVYCARGEMENRIKECQMDLFADRTSAGTMKANQLRLWFASMAYVLVENLRRIALQATDLAEASCGTIRRKLFKIGALVTISVRRIKFALASGCPYQAVFARAHQALTAAADTG